MMSERAKGPLSSSGLTATVCLVFVLGFASRADSQGREAGPFCEIPGAGAVADAYGKDAGQRGLELLPSRSTIRAGRVISARLLNFTETTVLYGSEFVIQRYQRSSGWIRDPASPDGPWPRKLSKLHQDEAGQCFRFSVPSPLAVGKYRFLTKVTLDSHRQSRVAEFRVSQ